MICLDCENRFYYEGWERVIECPDCGSRATCSAGSHDARIGYEKDFKEMQKVLAKKWGYGFGSF